MRISDVLPSLHRLRPVLTGSQLHARYCVPTSTPIGAAADKLLQNRLTFLVATQHIDVGAAAGQEEVAGMLTERDYLRFAVHADAYAFLTNEDPRLQPLSKIMTQPDDMMAIGPQTTVAQALRSIQHKIWRHLPVVENARLRSIIDIRDLILLADGGRTDELTAASPERPPGALTSVWHGKKAFDVLGAKRQQALREVNLREGEGHSTSARISLAEYLSSHARAHTVDGGASIERAAKQMTKERLTFLVVTGDGDGAALANAASDVMAASPPVIGLVNERDFLRYSVTQSEAPPHATAATTEVRSIMTPLSKVVHVSLGESVSRCLDVLFSSNVRHLPVIDGTHLSGIISLRDVLRPIIDTLEEDL